MRRGWDWYSSLFSGAGPATVRGESSTHYTKLPTFPRTVERMVRDLPRVKLIYVMRHPIDRVVSHYVHDVTAVGFARAWSRPSNEHPELIEYSRYAMQLEPFVAAYGFENVLPVFFSRLVTPISGKSLNASAAFSVFRTRSMWDFTLRPQNTRRDRLRPSPIRQALVQSPVLGRLRRQVLPRRWSQSGQEVLASSSRTAAVAAGFDCPPARGFRRRPESARLMAGNRSRLRELRRRDGEAAALTGPASDLLP